MQGDVAVERVELAVVGGAVPVVVVAGRFEFEIAAVGEDLEVVDHAGRNQRLARRPPRISSSLVIVPPRSSPPFRTTCVTTPVFQGLVTSRIVVASTVPRNRASRMSPFSVSVPSCGEKLGVAVEVDVGIDRAEAVQCAEVSSAESTGSINCAVYEPVRVIDRCPPPSVSRLPAAIVTVPEMSVRAPHTLLPLIVAVPAMLKSAP